MMKRHQLSAYNSLLRALSLKPMNWVRTDSGTAGGHRSLAQLTAHSSPGKFDS